MLTGRTGINLVVITAIGIIDIGGDCCKLNNSTNVGRRPRSGWPRKCGRKGQGASHPALALLLAALPPDSHK
jgi:hypothetical protein